MGFLCILLLSRQNNKLAGKKKSKVSNFKIYVRKIFAASEGKKRWMQNLSISNIKEGAGAGGKEADLKICSRLMPGKPGSG